VTDATREPGRYKDSVNLPQTKFDMRANAVKREPEIQAFWHEQQIYETLAASNPGEPFVIHDGPPYANGSNLTFSPMPQSE
jgi:isoleucyl-tRNA synthetase